MARGKVYLVGAGPGDPELITVKGKKLLGRADVIVYDGLVGRQALRSAKKGAKKISVSKIGRVHADLFSVNQEKINQILVGEARSGKIVVRLKNGDPFIFGRGGQEGEALAGAGISFEVIPGVTAATAAASSLKVPLTDRRYSSLVSFITGHEAPEKLKSTIDWNGISKKGTLVFYMGVETLPQIIRQLARNGRKRNTPVLIVEKVSLKNQRVTEGNLGNIVSRAKKRKVLPPAIIIVGEVIGLRNTLCKEKS
jgi:uroporphyrinogen III methyltransferase/synthase